MRMRRPGIVAKLVLVSAVLVAVPFFVLRYFDEVKTFVLAGQRNALRLSARAVSTVLHDREDLFLRDGSRPLPLADCSPLPLSAQIRLDGNARDWNDLSERTCRFERVDLGGAGQATSERETALHLALGERDEYLYGLFQVTDDAVRFRHPRYKNLDGSDHLRLALPASDGTLRRYVVTAKRAGDVTAYEVDEDWKYAINDGRPVPAIRGSWAETPAGFNIELRIPLEMIPGKQLGFEIEDVDESAGPIVGTTGPTPANAPGRVGLVDLPSPGIEQILRGLQLPGARITVQDSTGFVRADEGEAVEPVEPVARARLIEAALSVAPGAPNPEAFSGAVVSAASAPIRVGGRVQAVVLIEQWNEEVLGLNRDELQRAFIRVIGVCIGVAAVLWLFAWRLAWRIHRLRDDTSAAIDDDGRVCRTEVAAGRRAGDEVGDLSRTISGLLARLARYTGFLEKIPRTLRHELSNPLNTLSTSLQNLVADHPELEDSKYVQSAERGVVRIGEIVEGLTDAASLEEALRDDEALPVDLTDLVSRYVENFAAGCPQRHFILGVGDEPVFVSGSGFRIEQLLDKLVDNAVAWSAPGGVIEVAVNPSGRRVELRVGNAGAPIPMEIRERMFESMVSAPAASSSDRPHLGIGLYVVRLIVEHMGGTIEAHDRDGGGAVFVADLPRAASVNAAER